MKNGIVPGDVGVGLESGPDEKGMAIKSSPSGGKATCSEISGEEVEGGDTTD